MKQSIRALIVLLSWALLLPWAQARDLLAVGALFPKVFEPNAKGVPQGLAVDLLQRAVQAQGHSLRFEFYPWARAQAMVQQGQADILIGPYRTPEREPLFLFSQLPFYEDALIFYARRDSPLQWQGDFGKLQGRAVGLVKGWAYGPALEQAREQLHISTALDVASGLLMLQRGRVDLLASNERNTAPVIESMALGRELQPLLPALGHLQGHFAYPRNPQGKRLSEELDRSLGDLHKRGEMRELARRWKVRAPD
ncbi:ABC transporter substrate-binding protein [Paucibacter sp. KBW04]|uniref:substrate-binding periplasmic protein n=1 Tax=Paucibacter sp. KBW04 TaxID=2153361 RepID=UPI0018CC490B|nr:transporter substrate-binding domain-containing protein [Paucibacter sp. KBW04]